MRTKTLAVKPRRHCKPPSNPSFPLLHQGEAKEYDCVNGNDHGSSEDTCSSESNNDDGNGGEDKKEGDGCDDGDNYDNVVVPDSVEEVKRRVGENHPAGPSVDCDVVDWSEPEFCVRCNGGSGQLLVCSENGCPIAIHDACMTFKPKFDDAGKFCCPYCWYKREVARTKELRRKAMLAKKELANFIGLKRGHGNEEKQKNETKNMKATSESTMTGKINNGNHENDLNDDENGRIHQNQEGTPGVESVSPEKSVEERNSGDHGFENVGDENVENENAQEEDIDSASDSEGVEIDKDRWRIQPYTNHSETVKGTLHVSFNGTNDIVGLLEDNQGKRGEEELVVQNAVENIRAQIAEDATCKVLAIGSSEFVSPNVNSETLAVEENQEKVGKEEPVLQNALGTTMAQLTGDATSKMPATESCEFVLPDLHDEALAVEENQGKRREEEPLLPNEVGTTMEHIASSATPKMPAIETFEFIPPDLDNETLTVRMKHIKQRAQREQPQKTDSPNIMSSEPSTCPKDTRMNRQGKATAGENSVQCHESTKRVVIPTLGTDWENEMCKKRLRRFKSSARRTWPRKVDSPKVPSSEPSTSVKDMKINQHGKATAGENSVLCDESTSVIPSLGADSEIETPTAQEAQPQKVDLKIPPSEPSSSAKDTKMNLKRKATAGRNSVQCQTPANQLVIVGQGNEKRRRLHWTVEEEDMLKEGVQRFSTTVNKNIPWRKILEYGHQVFHVTRAPADLKDKWKNMAKEALKS